ncbi:hypothetical protein TDB9533_01468 [Thalassocella blandensis]|nr:hypothetical protein TDB9533_01468 [Thalassocella blandensis]
MKKMISTLCVVFIFGFTSVAMAQVYVGGAYGVSDAKSSRNSVPEMEGDAGYRVNLGNQLSNTFSFEVAYVDLGSYLVGSLDGEQDLNESSDQLDISGYELAVIGKLPLRKRLSLFARLGLFAWDGERVIVDSSTVEPNVFASSDEDVSVGLGVEMEFLDHMGVVLEANQYKTEDVYNQLYGLGVYFTF